MPRGEQVQRLALNQVRLRHSEIRRDAPSVPQAQPPALQPLSGTSAGIFLDAAALASESKAPARSTHSICMPEPNASREYPLAFAPQARTATRGFLSRLPAPSKSPPATGYSKPRPPNHAASSIARGNRMPHRQETTRLESGSAQHVARAWRKARF